jgi:hypothetical protein
MRIECIIQFSLVARIYVGSKLKKKEKTILNFQNEIF